jgi:putative hydrolase of the HAD superfamily
MIRQSFSHVRTWVFDLDNTLYPPSARLFDQIEQRMTQYVMRELGVPNTEADRLRQHYWQLYGTTLAGLMAEHSVDPLAYLHEVHEIDFGACCSWAWGDIRCNLRGRACRLPPEA